MQQLGRRERVDALVVDPLRVSRESRSNHVARLSRGDAGYVIHATAEERAMCGGGAHDPQSVAEPPETNRKPAQLRRVPHEIKTCVSVAREGNCRRHPCDDLIVVELGQLALRSLEDLEEARSLRRAEALIEIDESGGEC